MKRMFKSDLLRPKASRSESQDTGLDTPEANVARAIKAFCEAGKGGAPTEGQEVHQADEVTYLPIIVESAESSPTAAKEALYTIRKHMDMKNSKQGYQQYNALMLLRILVDNPGPTFTRNMDAKFLTTVKELYRGCRDRSVRQLLVENLEYFETKDDPGLQGVKEWYQLTKATFGSDKKSRGHVPALPMGTVGTYGDVRGGGGPNRRPKNVLPPPEELAARISEAQTSAKLLMQILQSTATTEVLSNQLITEFADRCSAASRSIQQFIEADSPPPDESTMLTLFETNEQLATCLSRHQMAIFSAKQKVKQESASRTNSGNQIPQLPLIPPMPSPPQAETTFPPNNGYRSSPSPPIQTQHQSLPPPQMNPDNPFNDPESHIQSGPYSNWRPEAQPHGQPPMQHPMPQQQGGYMYPNPVTSPEQNAAERHPMADVSPVSAPQVPHGYQPYRY